MKFVYPAIFHQNEDGTYSGTFPDLACCYADGDTLEEAVDNANEAARDWLTTEFEEDDWTLPPVTDTSELILAPGETVRNIAVNIRFYDGWDE